MDIIRCVEECLKSLISSSSDKEVSEIDEQYPEDPMGDDDLGVEYGEMVVQLNDGRVSSSDDTGGGEGVLAFISEDVTTSPGSIAWIDSFGEVCNFGDIDLKDVVSPFKKESL